MSISRNRAKPRLSDRGMDQELQGAQDAFIAFEGYAPDGPMLHSSALQRPAIRDSVTWWDRVIAQVRQRVAGIIFRGR